MDTVLELYEAVRSRFPEISARADVEYERYWRGTLPNDPYAWFQSLANVLNGEMQNAVEYEIHDALFTFIDNAIPGGSEEVFKCVDVSFVENLFWEVSKAKAMPYWQKMPSRLKELYVGFHHRTPL